MSTTTGDRAEPSRKTRSGTAAVAPRATLVGLLALFWILWSPPGHALKVDFQTFTDRQDYSGVLLQQGRVQTDADWNEEEEHAIQDGEMFGPFRFAFDPSRVQPAVVPGIVDGLAVGTTSDERTLGDGQGLSLRVTPGLGITAFGVEIDYSAGPLEDGVFRLIFDCADPPCPLVTNANAAGSGLGSLFLGIILEPGFSFDQVTIAVRGTASIAPGWQIAGITFSLVPEPATLALLGLGLPGLALARRRSGKTVRGCQRAH